MKRIDDDLMDALDAAREAFGALARDVGGALKDKYSPKEYGLLMLLNRLGRAKLKDIAEMVFSPKPLVCMRLGVLERRGLLARELDPDDRRNVFYTLTPAGAAKMDEIHALIRQSLLAKLLPLSSTDRRELAQSARAAAAVLGKLKN
ncbi:MAG: winged helix DNA-binding protein [Rickettsiales bacterium]|jgi:DNA-binding MarR family transcriptional regulator|nr:winged helix DNA-binding protein [Rickettsiales bacterium]